MKQAWMVVLGTVLLAALPGLAWAEADVTPGDGVWQVVLDKAAMGQPLTVTLAAVGGEVKAAACTILYNRAVHNVEPAGVKVAGEQLKGSIKVTLNADDWLPRDHKAVSCTYELTATVSGGKITGTYTGTCGPDTVSGSLSGVLEPSTPADPSGTLELTMEKAIQGGEAHTRRVTFTITFADGKAKTCTAVGFHPNAWHAKASPVELTVANGKLAGQVKASITSGVAAIGDGEYLFDLNGQSAGTMVVGKFSSKLGKAAPIEGAFQGTLKVKPGTAKPASRPAAVLPRPVPVVLDAKTR